MANQQGNGRNVSMPDESRPSWRPQDESTTPRSRRSMSDEDDRSMRDRYSHWDDRQGRWDRDDDRYSRRDEGRGGYNPERYGAQGGYGGGRGFEYGGGYGHEGERMSERGSWSEGQRGIGGESQWYGTQYGGSPYGGSQYGSSPYGGGGGMWSGSQGEYGGSQRNWQGGSPYGNERFGDRYQQENQSRFGSQGYGGHRGKGPSGFMRSDERVKEQVCEVLSDDDRIDATHIEVTVKNGEVVLSGSVEDRHQKRLAEDVVENISGVKDVQNQIRVGEKKTSTKEDATQDKRHRA